MPLSALIEKEALSSLQKRLDSVKSQLNPTDSRSNKLLAKITQEIQRLRKLHDQYKEREKEITSAFMLVVRNADGILNEFKSGKYGTQDAEIVGQLNDRLCTMDLDICGIHDKILASIRELPDSNSGSSSLQSAPSNIPLNSIEVPDGPYLSFLTLTINNLDAQLKHCLFCLSIFPENQKIKKKLLIHWWIGDSIVRNTFQGEECFSKLLDMDLIIPIYRERCQEVHSCKLHPWIRKLLVALAKNNGFLMVDLEGNPGEGHSRTHRVFLRKDVCLTGSNQEVWTLYNVDEQYLQIKKSWFAKDTPISVIQLGRWQESDNHHIEVTGSNFLNSIGTCNKLKYLCLRGISRIENLPNSIQKLENLRVLDLRACHNLEKLPREIKFLKNLEYLDVSECYLLEEMPKGLEHLSKLEVLKGFVIAGSRSKNPGRLSELTKLTELRTLSITISQESVVSVNELQKIGEINKLLSLTITWGLLIPEQTEQSTTTGNRESEMTFTFPPDIKKLDLRCFPAKSLPKSISPTNLLSLKKLYLSGGMLQTLGEEENWPVEILCVNFLNALEYDWEKLVSFFPNVQLVKRHNCPHLTEWPCDNHGIWRKDDTNLQVNTGAAGPLAAISSN